MENKKSSNVVFIPVFQKSFLFPRYWGSWWGVGAFAALAWVSPRLREPLLGALGRQPGNMPPAPRRRDQNNLTTGIQQ
ncbi:lauroyl-Kdo(2)-lipid IV(A) myristoyltransferase, partial [Erwinia amylovora]|nr:lauroyl-Kdo(2)-lipid IV(A) myristoyltransferase [Erwinia amylovora]